MMPVPNGAVDAPRDMTVTLAVTTRGCPMNAADKPVVSNDRNPPCAPLAFRVGAVGHRPGRLDNSKLNLLAATISTILEAVKYETHIVGAECGQLYNGVHPVMRAVSPLAEGADRKSVV